MNINNSIYSRFELLPTIGFSEYYAEDSILTASYHGGIKVKPYKRTEITSIPESVVRQIGCWQICYRPRVEMKKLEFLKLINLTNDYFSTTPLSTFLAQNDFLKVGKLGDRTVFFVLENHNDIFFKKLRSNIARSCFQKNIILFLEGMNRDNEAEESMIAYGKFESKHIYGIEKKDLYIYTNLIMHFSISRRLLNFPENHANVSNCIKTMKNIFVALLGIPLYQDRLNPKNINCLIMQEYQASFEAAMKDPSAACVTDFLNKEYTVGDWSYLFQLLILNLMDCHSFDVKVRTALTFLGNYNKSTTDELFEKNMRILREEIFLNMRNRFSAFIINSSLPHLIPTIPVVIVIGYNHFEGLSKLLRLS